MQTDKVSPNPVLLNDLELFSTLDDTHDEIQLSFLKCLSFPLSLWLKRVNGPACM